MKILVLNSGSSSLKYQVIDTETGEMLVKGYYERIGQVGAFLTHKVNGEKHHFEHPAKNHEKAIQFVMQRLTSDHYGVFKSLDELDAIGHRVVHGGEQFKDAVLITDEVIQGIKNNEMLAPLHNPAAILGIEACQKVVPNKPMVAVFDTAFHQTISKEKYIYPIPYEYYEKYHVRKYGFHGTSHQYVANRVAEILGKDIKDLKIGDTLNGTVRNVTPFGAFVDIGLHDDGLIHISKMSKDFVKDPGDILSVGEIIEVYVDSIDLAKKRIGLSLIK